ncbi:MAG: helix-turn-helix domain-containing protein [Acidimicrobiia bacterium]|nr:helix-turn-helix domain-containing protein [Acidimicrobiia bacterium]
MHKSTGQRQLIDVPAVAERLGVSERHIRRLVYERRIPFIKWGHLLRFDPRDIDAWIDDKRQEPERPAPRNPARVAS